MNLILGAGLAGLAASYHAGHENCRLLERKGHAYGHIHTEFRDGFTWDEGPHVSFTKQDYVRKLFAQSVDGDFDEYEIRTINYFRGHWIDHPAQSSLYQVPEPLRSRCLQSFLESRRESNPPVSPINYREWLECAFGSEFAATFPAAYTRKYWTVDAEKLATEWVGPRIFYPQVEDVITGSQGPLDRATHYITRARYPRTGGYQAFAHKLRRGAHIHYGAEVVKIDLNERRLWTADGAVHGWSRLINTLPLPIFIAACANVPNEVQAASYALACSNVLLINITAAAPTAREENWIYVYDEDKYSTRIHCTEVLTPGNAPNGYTGIQTEVYFSRYRPMTESPDNVGCKVMAELREMNLLPEGVAASFHTVHVPWANVIFTTETAAALEVIWKWLEMVGLEREEGDCHPLTDWRNPIHSVTPRGSLIMAGRFGQWKYFWTDDCVLRGKQLKGEL